MEKYNTIQELLTIILNAPLTHEEQLFLVRKIAQAEYCTKKEVMKKLVSYVHKYCLLLGERAEKEAKLYEAYDDILAQLESEIKKLYELYSPGKDSSDITKLNEIRDILEKLANKK